MMEMTSISATHSTQPFLEKGLFDTFGYVASRCILAEIKWKSRGAGGEIVSGGDKKSAREIKWIKSARGGK